MGAEGDGYLCAHCGHPDSSHADTKCLFGPTTFLAKQEFYWVKVDGEPVAFLTYDDLSGETDGAV